MSGTSFPVCSSARVHVNINHVCCYCCLYFVEGRYECYVVSTHLRHLEQTNDVTGKDACICHCRSHLTVELFPPTVVCVNSQASYHCVLTLRINSRTSILVIIFFVRMRSVLGQTFSRLFRTVVRKTGQNRQLSSASGKVSDVKLLNCSIR